MKLTFAHNRLKALLAEAEEHWRKKVQLLHGESTGPGFWIVGDEGVYMMHNGAGNPGKKQHVVYATECNPLTMHFDAWWAAKQATFGGDDGIDFVLSADAMRRVVGGGQTLEVEFTDEEMTITPRPATELEARGDG